MKPDNSRPPGFKSSTYRSLDSLLDPIPEPEVVESDSDTAWGRWEDSLQAFEEQPAPGPASHPVAPPDGFAATRPMELGDELED